MQKHITGKIMSTYKVSDGSVTQLTVHADEIEYEDGAILFYTDGTLTAVVPASYCVYKAD